MSRSISSSISALRTALSKCITSIKNKGVTVPSTTKVSGLSTYIDKIETTPNYTLTFDFTPQKVKYFKILINGQVGQSSSTKVFSGLKQGQQIETSFTVDGSTYYKVEDLTLGPDYKVSIPDFMIIIICDDISKVQEIQFDRSNSGPTASYLRDRTKTFYYLHSEDYSITTKSIHVKETGSSSWVQYTGSKPSYNPSNKTKVLFLNIYTKDRTYEYLYVPFPMNANWVRY